MATSAKRKGASKPARPSAKKQRDGHGGETTTPSAFDQLCDDTLLRILSYSNDLRSLIHFTRGTCKSLRNRFDPNNASVAEKSSPCCSTMWEGIMAELHMSPLNDADGHSHDHLAAVNYRLFLGQRLSGHVGRAKAEDPGAATQCYPLPLRHHHFKRMSSKWRFDDGYVPESAAVKGPFHFLSRGTGKGYAIIDPASGCLEVHRDIMDHTSCFDRSSRKRREVDDGDESAGSSAPAQTLMPAMDTRMSDWERCFGKDTPLHSYSSSIGIDDGWRICVDWIRIGSVGSVGNQIFMMRVLQDGVDESISCTEYMVWADEERNGRSDARFSLKSILRLPGDWELSTVSPNADRIYASTSHDVYDNACRDFLPRVDDIRRVVFQFPLVAQPSGEDDGHYPPLESIVSLELEDNDFVSSIQALDNHMLLVGSMNGCIDIWNCQGQPHRVQKLKSAIPTPLPFDWWEAQAIGGTAALGLVTVRNSIFLGGTICLMQPSTLDLNKSCFDIATADFKFKAKIRYTHVMRPQVICRGSKLIVLGYDRTGWLYVDVYHIMGSRFVFDEFKGATLPEDVQLSHASENSEKQILFANRIFIHHRVELSGSLVRGVVLPEAIVFDANERFIVVNVNSGLAEINDFKKSGAGLIVIDLDEHGS